MIYNKQYNLKGDFMKNNLQISFEKWKKRSKGNYINAICKPCWELKYCPYGVLVENFELRNQADDPYRCRIFGHLCPVFKVAEPLTETKEPRNISRHITAVTQRRVLRRDNYICQMCNKHIPDTEINFDHIIPWSKGGSSDESNIRLLCESCNKKRSNNYEDQYLLANTNEIFNEPCSINYDMVFDLLRLFLVAIELDKKLGTFTEDMFCDIIKTDDVETDKFLYVLISQLWDIFHLEKFFIPVKKKENLLKYRWGLKDGDIHSIDEISKKYNVSYKYYIELEDLLLRQIGFIFINKTSSNTKYSTDTIDNIGIKSAIAKILEKA